MRHPACNAPAGRDNGEFYAPPRLPSRGTIFQQAVVYSVDFLSHLFLEVFKILSKLVLLFGSSVRLRVKLANFTVQRE
jgi:hypothetical protein